jgi:hypothetical protein
MPWELTVEKNMLWSQHWAVWIKREHNLIIHFFKQMLLNMWIMLSTYLYSNFNDEYVLMIYKHLLITSMNKMKQILIIFIRCPKKFSWLIATLEMVHWLHQENVYLTCVSPNPRDFKTLYRFEEPNLEWLLVKWSLFGILQNRGCKFFFATW